jgi:hypothetical protein
MTVCLQPILARELSINMGLFWSEHACVKYQGSEYTYCVRYCCLEKWCLCLCAGSTGIYVGDVLCTALMRPLRAFFSNLGLECVLPISSRVC